MASEQPSADCPSQDLLCKLLVSRHIPSEYLEPSLDQLPDEALFANIDKVEQRIRTAMFRNESMVIFGHDDPDGITSTYILYNFLNSCGYQKHHYYIPNRNLEKHGIQDSFVQFVKEGGYKLVVTVDNGISAQEGVQRLNALGCDVIITDHHLVQPETLPPAFTILNPQLADCQYPFKSLAGVGVVLMLIRYLSRIWEHPIDPASYFWAAIGSIADKVPMIGLNRIIVRHVLENFSEVQDVTVEFLLRNYNRVGCIGDIYNFLQYTSHLIANGREPGGQHEALRFILQLSEAKAKLFQDLEKHKNSWEGELNKVFSFLDTLSGDFVGNSFVYFDDDDVIPYSLLGTAATYIVNKLRIPTIMLKAHNGDTVCEGRCAEGFNMVDAFSFCKQHLKQFGGHPKAAGFSMLPANYDAFLDSYNSFLLDHIEGANPSPITWDAEASLDDLNYENWRNLELLLPWGQMNPEPTLLIHNVTRAKLLQAISLDNSSVNLPHQGSCDVVVLWKSLNMVRVLLWQDCSEA